jgi:type IV fimbrial biogenesis protein FimT
MSWLVFAMDARIDLGGRRDWCRTARLRRKRAAAGFTLLEMLVSLAVVAVLVKVAVPSLNPVIESVKLSSATNLFVSGLILARGEAIKRNSRVALCKSLDGLSCAADGGWEQGWIVFHDANNNSLRENSESILRRAMPLSSSLRLTGNQNVGRYVSFAPSGATKLISGGFQAGTLTVCRHSTQAGEARQIILNAVGRPRVQRTAVDSCG